jgi:hypothetical protein
MPEKLWFPAARVVEQLLPSSSPPDHFDQRRALKVLSPIS